MKFIHSWRRNVWDDRAALFNYMHMHFDFFHPRDQIELTVARIYGRDMGTISDGNISILVSSCQVNEGKFKCGDITKVAFNSEVAIERLG